MPQVVAAPLSTLKKQAVDTESPASRHFWRWVTAEFVATFWFVFIAVGCAIGQLAVFPAGAGVTIPLAFGLTIFVLAHCMGHISGAHINPAVTLSLVFAKQIPPLRGGFYIVAQCVGSIVASATLQAVFDLEEMQGTNAIPVRADGSQNILGAVLVELITTMLLVFTVFATIDPGRESSGFAPYAIGMAVTVAHFIGVPVTGCGINPARSLGPALFGSAQALSDLWLFIVIPFVGSAIVAVGYPLWFAERKFQPGGLRGKYISKDTGASMYHIDVHKHLSHSDVKDGPPADGIDAEIGATPVATSTVG